MLCSITFVRCEVASLWQVGGKVGGWRGDLSQKEGGASENAPGAHVKGERDMEGLMEG